MAGRLYGVSVGPGDPELMTLKAVKVIKECDVIGIPAKAAAFCRAYQIACMAVPEMIQKRVIPVPVPMTTDKEALEAAYGEGCRQLGQVLDENKSIAFLNLGDATIYSTYMEIHGRMCKMGYEAEIVSGVPSFCAVAAALNLSLGSGNETIHILPGFYRLEEVERYEGTRILMKSAGKAEEVKEKLLALEREQFVTAKAVTNCGMADQAVCESIEELSDKAGYFTTIIVKEAH